MPCPGMSEAEIKQRVTAPGAATPNKPLWGSQVPLPDASQGCNSYLPNGQVMERYKWVVQHCVSAGELRGSADSARLACLCSFGAGEGVAWLRYKHVVQHCVSAGWGLPGVWCWYICCMNPQLPAHIPALPAICLAL